MNDIKQHGTKVLIHLVTFSKSVTNMLNKSGSRRLVSEQARGVTEMFQRGVDNQSGGDAEVVSITKWQC